MSDKTTTEAVAAAAAFTCFRCNDALTPLYCLNCAEHLLKVELTQALADLSREKELYAGACEAENALIACIRTADKRAEKAEAELSAAQQELQRLRSGTGNLGETT